VFAVSLDNLHMAQLENFRLKVFRAVAHHLNFHKAAEHLFLTQPAVTLQIKALESDLAVRLFDRRGGSVSVNTARLHLLTYANKIAALVSEAERHLGCKDGKVSGELSLGVSTTIAQYVLSRLLAAFLADYPQVDFTLHSGNTGEIVHLLLDGEVAVGLIEGPARVYPAFLRGDYDTTVFQAFREVEVAVREAGGFAPKLVGTKLMRSAFRPDDPEKPNSIAGPLTDKSLPIAEQKGMADLFSGAIELFKNPALARRFTDSLMVRSCHIQNVREGAIET